MAGPAAQTQPSRPDILPMYRALVGVGMLCGLLIVSVYLLTGPVIARNEARALEAAVFQVLPGASSKRSFVQEGDGFRPLEAGQSAAGTLHAGTLHAGTLHARTVHAGYDDSGNLVGIAVPALGMGYQDVIRVLYGYAPASETIVGMQVLASKETPGLGDRIEKDPQFLDNFRALDVHLAAGGQSLAHPIEAVKNGEKRSPWQIDGITGATISSKAIAAMLRDSSRDWVPLLWRQRAVFEGAGAATKTSEAGGEHGRH
jgi:electron transport complex protein RnfG